jgi:hypothetical protein
MKEDNKYFDELYDTGGSPNTGGDVGCLFAIVAAIIIGGLILTT